MKTKFDLTDLLLGGVEKILLLCIIGVIIFGIMSVINVL